MFLLDNLKVHQTLPGAGWRVLRTDLIDFDVTDDAVLVWVTCEEQDCMSGATWVMPLLKGGMLSEIYDEDDYLVEYLRPDATPDDEEHALGVLSTRWSHRNKKKTPDAAVKRG